MPDNKPEASEFNRNTFVRFFLPPVIVNDEMTEDTSPSLKIYLYDWLFLIKESKSFRLSKKAYSILGRRNESNLFRQVYA